MRGADIACLNVVEYTDLAEGTDGSLLIEDGVVKVLDFGIGDYRLPTPAEAAKVSGTLRRWAGQIENSAEVTQ